MEWQPEGGSHHLFFAQFKIEVCPNCSQNHTHTSHAVNCMLNSKFASNEGNNKNFCFSEKGNNFGVWEEQVTQKNTIGR